MRLDQLPWPDVEARAGSTVLAVPVGSTEQHGPHLPLSTDTEIATALCDGLASRRPDVLVAPPVAYGAAGEHAAFAGTLSIGTAVTEAVLVELGRSADAFAGVLFVSAHGGNAAAVSGATRRLVSESRRVRSWAPGLAGVPGDGSASGSGGAASGGGASGGAVSGRDAAAGDAAAGDAHAGRTETSVMLALRPDAVRAAAAAAGATAPLRDLMPALQAGGVRSVSPNGVLGDPGGASAAEGGLWLDRWTDALVTAVEGWP